MINLKIDPEFQSQIPPLTDDEFKQLEENILKEGKLLSSLIVWGNTLVDGHNRYEIEMCIRDSRHLPLLKKQETSVILSFESAVYIRQAVYAFSALRREGKHFCRIPDALQRRG